MNEIDQITDLMKVASKCFSTDGTYDDIPQSAMNMFLAHCSPPRIYAICSYALILEKILLDLEAEGIINVEERIRDLTQQAYEKIVN